MYIYIYKLNHFAVYQKLTQDCKSTVLQEEENHLTKRLLVLINEFMQIAGYKINIQKSIAFPYTNNKLPEREVEKTI